MVNRTIQSIDIRDLTFQYNQFESPAIHALNLKIPLGKITAVLGPNGSGKSTLFSLLLGHLKPNSGKIHINGTKLSLLSSEKRRTYFSYVPQEEILTFDLSVFEFVQIGRAPFLKMFQTPGETDARMTEQVINAVELAHLQNRSIRSISGGEKQLAMIARAMNQKTSILIMDEPTSHLDLGRTRNVLKIMKKLAGEGKTVVFSTHDPNNALSIADNIVLMSQGKLLGDGKPEQVINEQLLSSAFKADLMIHKINNKLFVIPANIEPAP